MAAASLAGEPLFEVERKTELFGNVMFRHPDAKLIVLNCGNAYDAKPWLSFSGSGRYPSSDFYAVIGEASAAVWGASVGRAQAIAKDCIKRALRSADKSADFVASSFDVSCSVLPDMGGSFSLTLGYKRRSQ